MIPLHRTETPLARSLKERIRQRGPITFRDFMSAALYDPNEGFYAHGPGIGTKEGAFDTSAKFPAFAFCLAQACIQAERLIGEPLRIVELGGGSGELGQRIHSWLPPSLSQYVIVEPSEGLRKQQIARGLQVVSDLQELSPAPSVVFGNEVLDALPVHRVMGNGDGGIWEFYVGVDSQGEFEEIVNQPSTPDLLQRLSEEQITLGRGQVAEINLELSGLVAQAARILSPGYLLFIDYGEEASGLYGLRHRNGTLRCFKRQQQVFDPFDCVGDQDLTADVDYTAVGHAAKQANLVPAGKCPQGEWLTALGIGAFPEKLSPESLAPGEIGRLTKASMLGGTFDVLAFKTRGLPDAPGFNLWAC